MKPSKNEPLGFKGWSNHDRIRAISKLHRLGKSVLEIAKTTGIEAYAVAGLIGYYEKEGVYWYVKRRTRWNATH